MLQFSTSASWRQSLSRIDFFVPVFSLLSSEDLFRVSTMSQDLYVLQPLLSLVSNSCLFPHRDAATLQLSILLKRHQNMFSCLFVETHRSYPCTKVEHALHFTVNQSPIFEIFSTNIDVYSTGKANEQPRPIHT